MSWGTSHTAHEDIHTHGLADDCPRCDEHAKEPFLALDDTSLGELTKRVRNDLPARSRNERAAMDVVYDVLLKAGRIEMLDNESNLRILR